MKKLLIFDKVTKQIVAKNNFWEDNYTIDEHWETYNNDKQGALIVDFSQKEIINGKMIQPADYNVKVSEPVFKTNSEIQDEIAAENAAKEVVVENGLQN